MSQLHASITFNENGTPISETFDDIYFSDSDGLEETKYVFLHRNGLPERWLEFNNRNFVVGETGFGTGLNFISTWQSLNEFNKLQNSRVKLKFITFEKFPLLKKDLALAYQNFKQLDLYTQQILDQYPAQIEQDTILTFEQGNIELQIVLGDVNERISNFVLGAENMVNAWYLDGFAPSKNPDMWTEHLFSNLARLGKNNCTIATFTAAGFVRRGLIDAGFDMKKYKGFGFKREMIAGTLSNKDHD